MECPDETTLSDFLEGLLPEGRRGIVLAHVEACDDCQRALAAAGGAPPPTNTGLVLTGAVPTAEPLPRGSKVARYVVLQRIGQGAMGVVYAAYDPELDREVALKVLRPEGRQLEELQRRLVLEAQALARLSHANVVAVYDVGTFGEGVFLAMELVDGTTLAEWLKTPRPWPEVLHVFVEAGRGLAAAHAAGLVHRDFKPANVLVGRDGRPRVTDFGMARPPNRGNDAPPRPYAETSASTPSPLTRTGALLGTPVYMAPELLKGQRADVLSDQFSFCVTLHEALYGIRPFEGDTLEALAVAALAGQVKAPVRDTQVPGWVRRAVLRGLSAEPSARFPSMEALLAALTPRPRNVRGRAVATATLAAVLGGAIAFGLAHRKAARCDQEVEKVAAAWSPERRERVHAAFLATGKPYAASAWEQLATALDAHVAQWRTLRTEACLASGDTSRGEAWTTAACLDTRLWQLAAVTGVLEKADAQTVANAQQVVASLDGLAGCQDAAALSARPQPPDALRPKVAEVRQRLAEAQARLAAGRAAEGIPLTTALIPEAQALGFRPLEAEVLMVHGQLHGLAGKPKEAEEILYKALWAADAGRDDETVARAWVLLLWVVGDEQSRALDAERIAGHARAAVERLGRERFPDIATDLNQGLGVALMLQGKLDKAAEEFEQGLELSRRAHGPESLRTASLLHQLGRLRFRQLRTEEALDLQRQAHALRERLLGTGHPDLAITLNSIGGNLSWLGRRDESIKTWREALALIEAAQPAKDHIAALVLTNLGQDLRIQGRLDEARDYQTRALVLFERTQRPDHPNTVGTLLELSRVATDQERYDEALKLCDEALARLQRALGMDSLRVATPLTYRSYVYIRMERYAEAREDLLRVLKLLEKENGKDHVRNTKALRALGEVAVGMHAPKEALAWCQRSLTVDEQAQGPNAPDVAADLSCLGEAHLQLGAVQAALPELERAKQVFGDKPRDLLNAAWGDFLLGQALQRQQTRAERERGLALVEEARAKLEELGPRARPEMKQLVEWQRRGGVR